MHVNYPIKVQAIRSKGRPVRLFIAVPLALASAIDLQPGEEVEWSLQDRLQLSLIRHAKPSTPPPPKHP